MCLCLYMVNGLNYKKKNCSFIFNYRYTIQFSVVNNTDKNTSIKRMGFFSWNIESNTEENTNLKHKPNQIYGIKKWAFECIYTNRSSISIFGKQKNKNEKINFEKQNRIIKKKRVTSSSREWIRRIKEKK